MRSRYFVTGCVVCAGSVAVAQAPATIGGAAWLQGCWEMKADNRTVEEMWTPPKGGSMIGVSRTVREGKLTEYEMIVLREQGEKLAYVAHPSGQAPATFLSTHVSDGELLFENRAHDFPQQIGYTRKGGSLLAWVSGTASGKTRRVEFPYLRVRCPE